MLALYVHLCDEAFKYPLLQVTSSGHGHCVIAAGRYLVVNLVDGFRMPLNAMNGFGDVDGLEFSDGLATFKALHYRQLPGIALDQLA